MKRIIAVLMTLLVVTVINASAETITYQGKRYNVERVGLEQVYFEIVMDKYNIDSEWVISYVSSKLFDREWSDWEELMRRPANGLYLNNSRLESYLGSSAIKDDKQVINGITYYLILVEKWWSEDGFLNALFAVYIAK